MKTPLLSIATLLSAMSAISVTGLAQAQSSVTVYGVVDAGIVYENNGSTTVTRMDSGILNSSRLGFKGTEDLGNGLNAIFLLESGFNVDTGAQSDAARLFNRQAFVGLTGAFGAVRMGRQVNPVYANNATFDPFRIGMAGDSSRLISFNGSRTDNLLTYSYAANGLRGELQYGAGEVAGNNSANRTLAGFAGYQAGPVDVVITHQNIRNAADTNATKMTLIGGNVQIDWATLYAAYGWEKGVILGTTSPLDQRDLLLGVRAKAGEAGTVVFSYIRKTDKAVANADATQVAIGYIHDLSKRTALYTSYGQIRNDGAAKYKVLVGGATDKVLNMGVRHYF
ncbi:porin [Undibacterium sp. Tian12W]|uniref:porin n=1 Tax=Undibacterium sp. Tian12W TaxID=3413054 RepID=UPI003BF2C99C